MYRTKYQEEKILGVRDRYLPLIYLDSDYVCDLRQVHSCVAFAGATKDLDLGDDASTLRVQSDGGLIDSNGECACERDFIVGEPIHVSWLSAARRI